MVIDLGILSIKVDVLIFQIINILLLLWIIRKAFGDTIVNQIAHFRETKKKLADAEVTLKHIISEAEKTRQEIVNEWKLTKEQIITQAHLSAQYKEKEIIEYAEHKAKDIINQAQVKANTMEAEIKENYSHLIKQSAGAMVKKIFQKNPQAQEIYIKEVMQEVI